MTKEKLQFELPVVFTIGPDISGRDGDAARENEKDGRDALMKYSMLLAESAHSGHESHEHIDNIIKGIIEGETRVLVSSMSKYLQFAGNLLRSGALHLTSKERRQAPQSIRRCDC